ncbi:4-hydroxybenzoate octaprenyltransferase [Pacificimonas sp. WHA3]|uniref:4-hydroxybenzoate octaprenyltransferase n=1 Tax=Pacificimonas pallii TaxID=2827236 RepID=A0ABS6SGV2_9SPHN|nr:4-hydroxybenzoate octaprenyltransferase [Pacificimonas pallii]MBV7257637.1 4-hydroxybenzoate octaprenyltransferase [Pacificimonas pallii]
MSEAVTPDAKRRSIVGLLPAGWRPWARLARLDRPIGTWLLFWPCAWGVFLAGAPLRDAYLIPLFLVGALAMRSAGCVYNDIVDRNLDAKVERTRSRPLASGAISLRGAWIFLAALCLIGLLVLIQLNLFAALVAMGSLVLVAAYPFMKRITWWPQAWLGLTFNWGALVGYAAATGTLSWGAVFLYLAGVFWTLGYDTIYALQDVEDDALAGIKSSARALGARANIWIALFYGASYICALIAIILAIDPWTQGWLAVVFAGHLMWQVQDLDIHDPRQALGRFRSNSVAGALLAAGILIAGL